MKNLTLVTILTVALSQASLWALNIKVIDSGVAGHGMVINAKNNLTALGHTVTAGGTLADYSAYDEVWDLRYSGNLTAADITAMGNFLAGGGSMYMTGEHTGFNSSRNNSLISWINGVGGGAVSLLNINAAGPQAITPAGQVVNSPNTFSTINFNAANTVGTASTGNGFLVSSLGSYGSLLGWDFGDITGAAGARLLVGFDIEIFQNGINWTENMVTYLAANQSNTPEAGASLVFLAIAVVALGGSRRLFFA